MRIGVPREIKDGERRVGLTPGQVRELVELGHEVRCESRAGAGIGVSDEDYGEAGARIVDVSGAWDVELIVKVKDLQPGEAARLQAGSTVFCFQQLAAAPGLTRDIAARGANAIAYELVRDAHGAFPLLAPMSVIAGRMAVPVGAHLLGAPQGGCGTLLARAPGAEPAQVLVLGAGNAGSNAAELAAAMGARVTLLCRSESTRAALRARFGERVRADLATPQVVEAAALAADLVIGAVFLPATPTPKLLARPLVERMKRGAVLVDISIDAGGVAETSRLTTHSDPTFVEAGVVHYCVSNMPAAFPRTATQALSSAVFPFVRELARLGIGPAVRADAALRAGVLIWNGIPTYPGIAANAGLDCIPAEAVFS